MAAVVRNREEKLTAFKARLVRRLLPFSQLDDQPSFLFQFGHLRATESNGVTDKAPFHANW
jgi:hypothetical protein